MKIAFIATMNGSPWGGSELLWSQAADILHKQGHQILASVHGWLDTPQPIRKLRDSGILVKERHPEQLDLLTRVVNKSKRVFLGSHLESKDWLEIIKFKPDLVCISHGGTICGVSWMLRCLNAKIPYLSISQGYSERDWIADREIDDVTSAYLGARKAFFVAENNRKLLETKMGERVTQAEVVWNPFNVPWDNEIEWPSESQGLRLACVGRLEPYDKGQDILCQIMAKPEWRQRSVTIHLYGNGSCRKSISKFIKMLQLEEKVFLRGQVNDITQVWQENHCAIMPSRTEGLPLALVEGMLCHRFAIATDVGDTSRPMIDNFNGFIASAPTVNIFEEAMERAWARRQEWKEIGRNARFHIEKMVPPNPSEIFAEKILKVFP